jgi:5S rRNA maturation endonuclease (ribonuclease M5)
METVDLGFLSELKDKAIIVEGKRDVRALEALGIYHAIPINGRPLVELVSLFEGKETVILTDFDAEGKRLAAQLRRLFERYKIKTCPRLRRKVFALGKPCIEELRSLGVEIKEGDYHGQISANFNKIHNKGDNKSQWCN